ncbi:D-hexose-6-phosphate mutarotase [Pseudomonas sp. gcc21]|uniref:D-hexose-6-phosphate mutarotase n=1 Tax=Pseudomonas sp. gcc21 TaxID=2726989 RepID=UPI00145245E1|nr:D-hexose-6-phosphate mutarotase [Pseudomonas sp. gcc21]QJD58303.1 D-hexose-6-phosphate mutarotase [Pseudomonas sp. gcc21]
MNVKVAVASKEIRVLRNIHGREFLEIDHPAVQARISLEGAHIVSCVPAGEEPLLWMSPIDPEEPGKPLRGGVPICWPWFAGERPGPAHGIARTSQWVLTDTYSAPHLLRLLLELPEDTIRKQLPGEAWRLQAEFELGQSLSINLITTNLSDKPQVLSQALHSYLPVHSIHSTQLWGLEGASYVDQVTGVASNTQHGAVTFTGEVDRIYYDHRSPIQLEGAEDQRVIVARDGSQSVVVWNPWIDKSTRLSQFPDDGYLGMVCIEAANAGPDARILEPGETHTLSTEIKRI